MSPPTAAAGDDRLMAHVKAGSVDAFGELYDRYINRAYRVAWSVCHDSACAEEAVQEAFASAWKSRAAYLPQRGTVAAWLLTVVRHRAMDLARRDHKHDDRCACEDALDARPAPLDVAEQAVTREEAHDLRYLLTQLPDAQREVITLAFYGELSQSEIAKALGLSPGTVKGRMRLGLHKLRVAFARAA